MQREIRPPMPIEFTCDWCRSKAVTDDTHDLPEGWGKITLTDCGLTGYTRADDVCGDCLTKHNLKAGDRI